MEGCGFKVRLGGDCSRHTWGKRQDVNSCLRVLRTRHCAPAQVVGVWSDE